MLNTLNTMNNVRIIAVAWNKNVQVRMMKILLGIFGGIALMWFLNIIGLKGLNLIPFFLGSLVIVVAGLSPITLGLVALTGTFFSRAQGESIVQASADEIKGWVTKVLPALLFGTHVLVGFLATWSFKDAPFSFWLFAAASMTIVSTLVVYDMKGTWLPTITITYSLCIMAFALWGTIADDAKELNPFAEKVPTVGTYEVTEYEYIGLANGTYTIRSNIWTVVEWPDNWCVMRLGGSLITKEDDTNNRRWFLATDGTQETKIGTVPPGDTWHGTTC